MSVNKTAFLSINAQVSKICEVTTSPFTVLRVSIVLVCAWTCAFQVPLGSLSKKSPQRTVSLISQANLASKIEEYHSIKRSGRFLLII